MTRKQVGRNVGNSERINVSGSELDTLGLEISDAVDVEVTDTTVVAHALIDNKDRTNFSP